MREHKDGAGVHANALGSERATVNTPSAPVFTVAPPNAKEPGPFGPGSFEIASYCGCGLDADHAHANQHQGKHA